jgi:hypothetical protein
MCVYAVSARHGKYSITRKVAAVLLFKSAANLQLCVGDTVITARRLMKVVVDVFTTRCDGGPAQQGHAVSGSDPSAVPISWWVDLAVRGRVWLVQAINTWRLKTTRIGKHLRIAEEQGGQRCRQPPRGVSDSPTL